MAKRSDRDDRPTVTEQDLKQAMTLLQVLLPILLELARQFRFVLEGPKDLAEDRRRFEAQQEELRTVENEPREGNTPSPARPTIRAEATTSKAKGDTPKASAEAACGTNSRTGEPVKGKHCGGTFLRKVNAEGQPIGGYRCGACSPKSGNGLPTEPKTEPKAKRKGKGKGKAKRNKAAEAASAADTTASGPTPRGNRGGSTEKRCRVCGKRFIGCEDDKQCDGQQGECAKLFKNARDRLYKRQRTGKGFTPDLPADYHKAEGNVLAEIATHPRTPDTIRAHLMATDS